MPRPDKHGWYRVRRRGQRRSPVWSTRRYLPEKHVIVPGAASDSYGAALPTKYPRLWTPPPVQAPEPGEATTPAATSGQAPAGPHNDDDTEKE